MIHALWGHCEEENGILQFLRLFIVHLNGMRVEWEEMKEILFLAGCYYAWRVGNFICDFLWCLKQIKLLSLLPFTLTRAGSTHSNSFGFLLNEKIALNLFRSGRRKILDSRLCFLTARALIIKNRYKNCFLQSLRGSLFPPWAHKNEIALSVLHHPFLPQNGIEICENFPRRDIKP